MLRNRQVTIVTIHNYEKSYEVGGNVSSHLVGGEWWRKRRVVKLYENFYAKSSFIKQAPVAYDQLQHQFDHLKEHFSDKEVQLKMFCLPVKANFLPNEDINETLVYASFYIIIATT